MAVALLAACGGSGGSPAGRPGAGHIDHATGGGDVVLRVTLAGGFVHPEPSNSYPQVTLYGDGRVITRGPTISQYPGPSLPNLVEFRLDEAGIQHVPRSTADAGVLDRHPPDYGKIIAADVPSTVITVRAGGAQHRVSVFGLGLDPKGRKDLDADQAANRERLRRLVDTTGDSGALKKFVQPGSERRYQPTELALFVSPYQPADSTPEPQPTTRDWPLGDLAGAGAPTADGSDTRCSAVGGDDAVRVLDAARAARDGDVWRAGDAIYSVGFRPLLLDEHSCDDLATKT